MAKLALNFFWGVHIFLVGKIKPLFTLFYFQGSEMAKWVNYVPMILYLIKTSAGPHGSVKIYHAINPHQNGLSWVTYELWGAPWIFVDLNQKRGNLLGLVIGTTDENFILSLEKIEISGGLVGDKKSSLRFQISFIFTPIWGRFPTWLIIFQMGGNHQLVQKIGFYIKNSW